MTAAERYGHYLTAAGRGNSPRQRRRDLHKRHRASGYDGPPLAHADGKGTATPRRPRRG